MTAQELVDYLIQYCPPHLPVHYVKGPTVAQEVNFAWITESGVLLSDTELYKNCVRKFDARVDLTQPLDQEE